MTILNNHGVNKNITVKRGEIFFANIPEIKKERTCVQQGKRPVIIIISNEKANEVSPLVTVVVLTTRMDKHKIPTHVLLGKECGLRNDSLALCEMILTLDKEDLLFNIGFVPENKMREIDRAKEIQTQPSFDESYIQKLIYQFENLKESFRKYRDEFLKQLMINTVDELEKYCNNYGKDYTIYLGSNNTINERMSCAV